jgi:hypothetical protein
MPISLAESNLPKMPTDGFFNEFEAELLNHVLTEGSGFYKLTQLKESGRFVSAVKVTEADDGAILNDLSDRLILLGETEDYMFVDFVV